jgi:hypothetical protein
LSCAEKLSALKETLPCTANYYRHRASAGF